MDYNGIKREANKKKITEKISEHLENEQPVDQRILKGSEKVILK